VSLPNSPGGSLSVSSRHFLFAQRKTAAGARALPQRPKTDHRRRFQIGLKQGASQPPPEKTRRRNILGEATRSAKVNVLTPTWFQRGRTGHAPQWAWIQRMGRMRAAGELWFRQRIRRAHAWRHPGRLAIGVQTQLPRTRVSCLARPPSRPIAHARASRLPFS